MLTISPFRRCYGGFLWLLVAAGAMQAADFPPPDQLKPDPSFPDPLRMVDGATVTTKEQWELRRKPELKALFQHYMYGRLPPTPQAPKYEILFTDSTALSGKGKLSEVKITFDGPAKDHPLYVLLVVPAGAAKPPVFLG